MSDMFDHEADAFDDYCRRDYYDEDYGGGQGYSRARRFTPDFVPNPLYYHQKIAFDKVAAETDRAYCLAIEVDNRMLNVWLPKTICRHLDLVSMTVWVHRQLYKKCLLKAKLNSAEADFAESITSIAVGPINDTLMSEPFKIVDGTIMINGALLADLPFGEHKGPLHINCRSAIVPIEPASKKGWFLPSLEDYKNAN